MPLLGKSQYPDLVASSSFFDTTFKDHADLSRKYTVRALLENDRERRGDDVEHYPAPAASRLLEPLRRLVSGRKFKQVSFRDSLMHPTSTGTSKTGVTCATNGVGPCTVVIMTGASPDETRRNARLFHVFFTNRKAGKALAEYKKCLVQNGLTDVSAILAGSYGNPEVHMADGEENAPSDEVIRRSEINAAVLHRYLEKDDVRIIEDATRANRPSYLTTSSTVGFELYKTAQGKIKLDYWLNGVFG